MTLQLQPYTQADLEQNPRLRDALNMLGEGHITAAIAELRQQAGRGWAGAAFLLAAIYFREQQFENAVEHVAACETLAQDSAAWTVSGAASLRLGHSRNAYDALRRALQLDSNNTQAHRLVWDALDAMGFGRQARQLAQQVIERDYAQLPSAPAKMPDLRQVTACAVDCVTPGLAARALRISASQCRFGAVKLLTSTGYRAEGVETVAIPHIDSLQAYSSFVIRGLLHHVSTDFALLMQWDGYVLSPAAWTAEFLDYDYIGARWVSDHLEPRYEQLKYEVGNGGFSLRSRRLMAAADALSATLPIEQLHPEDALICRFMRPLLEQQAQLRFGPGSLADRFAVEHSITDQETFGFHGDLNMGYAIGDPAYSRLGFLDALVAAKL